MRSRRPRWAESPVTGVTRPRDPGSVRMRIPTNPGAHRVVAREMVVGDRAAFSSRSLCLYGCHADVTRAKKIRSGQLFAHQGMTAVSQGQLGPSHHSRLE